MKNTAPAPQSAFTHRLQQRAHQWAGKSAQRVSHWLAQHPRFQRSQPVLLAGLAGVLGHVAIAPKPYAWAVLCFGIPLFLAIELAARHRATRQQKQPQSPIPLHSTPPQPPSVRMQPWASKVGQVLRVNTVGLGTAVGLATLAGGVAAVLGGEWVVNTAHVYGHLPLWAAWGVNLGYGLLQGLEWGWLLGGGFWLFGKQRGLRTLALPLTCLVGQWFLPRLLGYTFGQSLTAFPWLLQGADVFGASGLTWLLLFWQMVAFEVLTLCLWPTDRASHTDGGQWLQQDLSKGINGLVLMALGSLMLALGYGAWRTKHLAQPSQPKARLHLAAVQPNFSLGHLASNPALAYSQRRQNLQSLLKQSTDALKALPPPQKDVARLLLWPESVYGAPLHHARPLLQVRQFALRHNTQIIFPTLQVSPQGIYGVSVHVGRAGEIRGLYQKMALIPFGETIPLGKQFPALKRWIKHQIPNIGLFLRGQKHRIFTLAPGIHAAPLICFDLLDQRVTLGMAQQGATLGLVQANLAWFGKSPVSTQFAWYARMRAVEHRLPIVVLSQNGQSMGFSALGQPNLPTTAHFQPAHWAVNLPVPLHPATLYTRFAWPMHWILLALWIGCVALVRRRF